VTRPLRLGSHYKLSYSNTFALELFLGSPREKLKATYPELLSDRINQPRGECLPQLPSAQRKGSWKT